MTSVVAAFVVSLSTEAMAIDVPRLQVSRGEIPRVDILRRERARCRVHVHHRAPFGGATGRASAAAGG